MSIQLTTMNFVDLKLDTLFIAYGCLWLKIDPCAARSAGYGCCNFVKDPKDKVVQAVSFRDVSDLVMAAVEEVQ